MDTALIVTASESYVEMKRLLSMNAVVSDNVRSLREARMALCDVPYSLLLIDNPLPDGSAREFAIESSRRDGLDIILLTSPAVAERVSIGLERYGVYVLSKPIRENELAIILRNMRIGRKRREELEAKCRRLLRRLEEERTLTRAKCLLALKEGIGEDEGHRVLEKKAMNERITLLDAASEIILKYSK